MIEDRDKPLVLHVSDAGLLPILSRTLAASDHSPGIVICESAPQREVDRLKEIIEQGIVLKDVAVPLDEEPSDRRAKYYAKKLRKLERPRWRQ